VPLPNQPNMEPTPVVMTFADLDPSGAAGIQADVETLFSMGCHCSSIATAITAQDTYEYHDSIATDPVMMTEQARAILEDMLVSVFKVGQVGSIDTLQAIYAILRDYPEKPVIYQPSLPLQSRLFTDHLLTHIRNLLLPLSSIITINTLEANFLAPQADTIKACINEILDAGPEYVLVTGIGGDLRKFNNALYTNAGLQKRWEWERLPHTYQGSGSTLSASIAAHIAHGFDAVTSIEKAQNYTWHTLKNARRLGMGNYVPNRMYWINSQV
jgi:hydroxymethylpyrimidine/phosphomethylpyrimidine kinase